MSAMAHALLAFQRNGMQCWQQTLPLVHKQAAALYGPHWPRAASPAVRETQRAAERGFTCQKVSRIYKKYNNLGSSRKCLQLGALAWGF